MRNKNRTVQGKAESAAWRREATLRDLLDLLDDIEKIDKHPEEKAKLRQRVIDYGQHLSEQIFLGKREVPATDDNETIKEFNNRFFSTYDTKGKSSYEEAKLPPGYYDKKGKFVRVLSSKPKTGNIGARNPRWHPIPLRDVTPPPPPPVYPPIDPIYDGSSASSSDSDKNKRRPLAWWLIPLVLGAATITYRQCTSAEGIPPAGPNEENKDTTELVTKVYNQNEKIHLQYTVEKGEGLLAKQLGIKDKKLASELYEQCVENIRQGKIPENMKELAKKYQMSKMVDDELGINLDEPEIAATGWLVMSTSYDNVRQVILDGLLESKEMSTKDSIKLDKRLSLANEVAVAHHADARCSQVFTIDYGLYGASKKTKLNIWQDDFVKYQDVVNRVFKDKDGQGY